jgi:hypothetical protein
MGLPAGEFASGVFRFALCRRMQLCGIVGFVVKFIGWVSEADRTSVGFNSASYGMS